MSTTAARGTMPLPAHVREARRRGLRAAVALTICVAVGFWASATVLDVLRGPVEDVARSRDASLNYTTVTSAFDLRLRIALVVGVVLSSPVWLRELGAFVAPGLVGRERRLARGFLVAALPLFAVGCAFGLWIFPHMVQVLTGFAPAEDSTILDAAYYVDFVLKIVVATGVAFVLPVVVVVLNLLGVLPARTLRRGWRLVVVGITLFSGLVTPAADVLSMALVAAPMCGLFAIALALAHVHDRRVARRLAPEASAALTTEDA